MREIRVVLAVACALVAGHAWGRGLLATPSQLGLVGKAGTAVSDVVHIGSSRDEPAQVRITISDFVKDEEGRAQPVAHEQAPRSCASWLRLDQGLITAPGGRLMDVRITATIPAGAEGSYWAMLNFELVPEAAPPGKGVGVIIVPGIGVPVIVTVIGTDKRQLTVTRVEATRTDGKIVVCKATVENTGNVAVLVSGAFTLEAPAAATGGEPIEVASTDVGPLTSYPGGNLRITAKLNWSGGLAGFAVHSYFRWGPDAKDTSEASTDVEEPAPAAGAPPTAPAGKLLPPPPIPTVAQPVPSATPAGKP